METNDLLPKFIFNPSNSVLVSSAKHHKYFVNIQK